MSGADRHGRKDEGPRRVGESLDAVVQHIGPHSAREFGAIFGRWEEIVGPALAAHVRPVRATTDALVVSADHPAWATQIRAIGATLLAQIGEATGWAPDRLEVVIRRS
ncbi:MAG: DciA family protein [Acidimicrobiales bacterium]